MNDVYNYITNAQNIGFKLNNLQYTNTPDSDNHKKRPVIWYNSDTYEEFYDKIDARLRERGEIQ